MPRSLAELSIGCQICLDAEKSSGAASDPTARHLRLGVSRFIPVIEGHNPELANIINVTGEPGVSDVGQARFSSGFC